MRSTNPAPSANSGLTDIFAGNQLELRAYAGLRRGDHMGMSIGLQASCGKPMLKVADRAWCRARQVLCYDGLVRGPGFGEMFASPFHILSSLVMGIWADCYF